MAFIAFNWKVIFYIVISKSSVTDRISYVETHTDVSTGIIFPLGVAVIFSILYPWLHYLALLLSAKPVELRNILQAESENKFLIKKKELEAARADLFAVKENELIERAKRDEQLDEIENDDVRERLKRELDELRNNRDTLNDEDGGRSTLGDSHEMLRLAGAYRERSRSSMDTEDSHKLLQMAKELEDKAHANAVK